MSIYDKATEEWFSKRPGQESTVEQCDQCGLYYKPSLGHKCKVKAGEKTMTIEEAKLKLMSIDTLEDKALYNAICVAIEALEKQIPKEAEKTSFSIDRYVEKDILTGKTMCPVCGNTIFFHIEGCFKEQESKQCVGISGLMMLVELFSEEDDDDISSEI